MRNLISVLCLLVAGLLSVSALAGHQVDQLLREEEPIQHIAGDLTEDPAFSEAVTDMVVDEAVSALPEGIQQFVPGGVSGLVRPLISSALDNERTTQAWDEVLQTTRSDYTEQLEQIFAEGTTGDTGELDLPVDFTPVTDAMTEPLREGLEGAVGMVPGVDAETVEIPTPTVEIDIEAATDESADPYTWATAATLSQYWAGFGIGAAALAGLGGLLGLGRIHWAGMALGAAVAALLGLWIATTAASPQFQHPAALPEAGAVMLDHVQSRFTDWAQPGWWVFTGVAGFIAVVGVLAAVVTPARREH